MSHRGVRVIVFLAAAAVVAAGGYYLLALERRFVAERSAERVFEGQAHEAALLVERARTAQQSFVADGQGVPYWMGRLDDTRAALARALAGLGATATADAARQAAGRASSLASQHRLLDQRARTYLANGQRLMASDLIFTESSGLLGEIARYVDQARTEQRTASGAREDAIRAEQAYVLAGVAAICLLCALALVPTTVARPRDPREALGVLMQDATPAGGTLVRPESAAPLAVRAGQAGVSGESPAPSVVARAPAAPVPADTGAAAVDLASTARLCAELARVADPADLPALLARAADLLDASGVIVWVADRSGTALFPMLAHGYPPHVLARMGSINRDADNAAAAAYREGELRTVAAHGTLPGALVAPIITPEGCVGVLAAEMRRGAERHDATQAVAGIVAAQLATFVTTLPATAGETQ